MEMASGEKTLCINEMAAYHLARAVVFFHTAIEQAFYLDCLSAYALVLGV